MALTKGQINKFAQIELKRRNVECWLTSNSRTVKGHTFKGRLGVPDINGFHTITGVYVGCEVKTLTDKMRPEQHEFLLNLKNAGGISLVATEDKRTGNILILDYAQYRERYPPKII